MKLADLARKPSGGCEGMVRRLVRVDETHVDLSSIIDHIAAYPICAGILTVAGYLGRTGELVGKVSAALLLVLLVTLLTLNIVRGLVLASVIGITRWAGILLALLMLLVVAQLAIVPGL